MRKRKHLSENNSRASVRLVRVVKCEKIDAICDRCMHVVGNILMNGVCVCVCDLIRHVSVCNNCV